MQLETYERQLVDRFFVEQDWVLNRANFCLAVAAVMPTWRSEDLLRDHIDDFGTDPEAYIEYCQQLDAM